MHRLDTVVSALQQDPFLLVLYGEELGKRYYLTYASVVFGRSEDADGILDNPSVSRRHFVIHRRGPEVVIEDKGSTNGTFVNGQQIGTPTVLEAGDLVSVGNVILKFVPHDESDRFFASELFRLSTIDPVTDTYNKPFFLNTLAKELERSLRYAHPLSLLQFDVDDFHKQINNCGAATADTLLRALAERLLDQIRTQDVLARYSDDTFAVLLPETPLDQAIQVAERIRVAIAEDPFELNEQATFNVTASMGVCALSKSNATVAALLRSADEALSSAKKAGKNRVVGG